MADVHGKEEPRFAIKYKLKEEIRKWEKVKRISAIDDKLESN